MTHHAIRFLGIFFIGIALAKAGYAFYLYRKDNKHE